MVRAEGAGEDVRLVVRLPRTDRELQRHRLIQRLEIVIKHLDKPLNRKHFEKIKTCTCFILDFSIHKIVFLRIQFCEIWYTTYIKFPTSLRFQHRNVINIKIPNERSAWIQCLTLPMSKFSKTPSAQNISCQTDFMNKIGTIISGGIMNSLQLHRTQVPRSALRHRWVGILEAEARRPPYHRRNQSPSTASRSSRG